MHIKAVNNQGWFTRAYKSNPTAIRIMANWMAPITFGLGFALIDFGLQASQWEWTAVIAAFTGWAPMRTLSGSLIWRAKDKIKNEAHKEEVRTAKETNTKPEMEFLCEINDLREEIEGLNKQLQLSEEAYAEAKARIVALEAALAEAKVSNLELDGAISGLQYLTSRIIELTPPSQHQGIKQLTLKVLEGINRKKKSIETAHADQPAVDLEEKYEIIRPLDAGGMGLIFLVKVNMSEEAGKRSSKTMVLKLLDLDYNSPMFAGRNGEKIKRGMYEMSALRRCSDELKIVKFLDGGRTAKDLSFSFGEQQYLIKAGTIFIVEEYLEGKNLVKRLLDSTFGGKKGRMDPIRASKLVIQMIQGAKVMHERGLLHRDIKPANIMHILERVEAQEEDYSGTIERIVYVDFGIGKQLDDISVDQTQTSVVSGTPPYMPPEQTTSLTKTDWRSDLYSIGAVYYELITGECLVGDIADQTSAQVFFKINNGDLQSKPVGHEDIPEELQMIIASMIQHNPDQREGDHDKLVEQIRAGIEKLKGRRKVGEDPAYLEDEAFAATVMAKPQEPDRVVPVPGGRDQVIRYIELGGRRMEVGKGDPYGGDLNSPVTEEDLVPPVIPPGGGTMAYGSPSGKPPQK